MRVPTRISQLLLSLVMVIACPAGWSQIAADPGRSSGESNAHSLSGVVINSITRQPIARALVQIGAHAALTGHDGEFELQNVTEGEGTPIASKPGYFPKVSGVTPQSQPVVVELVPEAIVSGAVTDRNGQPIQDLRIQLRTLQVRNGLSHWQQIQTAMTNTEGEFRFAELEAGKYSLTTSFHIEGPPEATSSVAFVPITYPQLDGQGSGGALSLKPGDHVEAQINAPAEKLYSVTGMIPSRPGERSGFQLETQDGEMINVPIRFNREAGTFLALLPTGSYRLIARSATGGTQWIGMQDFSVGHAPLKGVTVTLEPAPSIPVAVDFQSVNTSAQEDIQAATPRFLNVFLQQADAARPMRIFSTQNGGPVSEQVYDSGRPLVISYVEPGRYELQVNTGPPWYLAAASCGNVDLTRDPLVVGMGVAPCTIHAVLRNDPASLKWSIASGDGGNATEPFSVIAIPLDNVTQPASFAGSQRPATAAVPAQGSFENLAPGRYLVIALQVPQQLPYRDVTALNRYSSLGKEVTLTANEKLEIQLDAVAGEP